MDIIVISESNGEELQSFGPEHDYQRMEQNSSDEYSSDKEELDMIGSYFQI